MTDQENSTSYKKTIIKLLDNINDLTALKRIYKLVYYISIKEK